MKSNTELIELSFRWGGGRCVTLGISITFRNTGTNSPLGIDREVVIMTSEIPELIVSQ